MSESTVMYDVVTENYTISENFTELATVYRKLDAPTTELNLTYAIFEGLVALMAVIGNAMVIIVFKRERRLRRRTNFYIVSLASADFLVGSIGIPFAVLASVGLPKNLHACLFTVSLLVVLCTISIFCLVAVSVDRYWAILHPMAYSRNVRTKTAIVIISMCWVAGTIIGFLPLFGWHANPEKQTCLFVEVMDYDYLVFLYFATIITPALILLAFYAHIYRVIVKQLRQIVTMNPIGVGDNRRPSESSRIKITRNGHHKKPHGGTMLRVLGAAQKREVKATQNLSIIVLFFIICWIPLYTINCIKAFCQDCYIHPRLTIFCIILSHLNSAVNPLLYAYHLKDFRAAMKNFILSMFGFEVNPHDINFRGGSLASQQHPQHRHSIMEKRLSLQPRIYIDSPIWLRSQQLKSDLQLDNDNCTLKSITKKITHSNKSTPAKSGINKPHEMWGIAEVSSTAEKENTKSVNEIDINMNIDKMSIESDEVDEEIQKIQNQESFENVNELCIEYEYCDDEDDDDVFETASTEIVDDKTELPFQKASSTERLNETENVNSLYHIVLSKPKSKSSCNILNCTSAFGFDDHQSLFLVENHHKTIKILNNNNKSSDNLNNNCNKNESSPHKTIANILFNNNHHSNTNNISNEPHSHSAGIFKIFGHHHQHHHQNNVNNNKVITKRSLSNDK